MKIFTIGHSNRSIDDFLTILKNHKIELLVDVRRFPTSKFEHFKRENLEKHLQKAGIKYLYLGHPFGGFRKGGYEKFMEEREFKEGIETLIELSKSQNVAIMCAEKLYFRCHRRFIANELENRGIEVIHLQ